MAKQSLLVVDGDTRSLRLLEVSLKKAGYEVSTAINGVEALAKLEARQPDLIISDTHMIEMDGFEFCKRLKQNQEWVHIPFIFLADQKDLDDKIHGLELGVDDYLSKPIYLKEIISRVQILLEKHQHRNDRRKGTEARTQFHGQLQDMAVVDLIQTIEIGRKSGVIFFKNRAGKHGSIFFRNGKVIDAELSKLSGEEAVYRLLSWTDGEFNVEFKNIRRREVIELSSQGLLMEGMRRLDEWGRLCEQIPPLDTVLEVDTHELNERLSEMPDELNGVLKMFDGSRSIMDVVDECEFGDLEALNIIAKLYFEGLITWLTPREISAQHEWNLELPSAAAPRRTIQRDEGNIIRFPIRDAPKSMSSSPRAASHHGMLSNVQAMAPNPNDLLEPVVGETLHVPRPEPSIPTQPTVIIQEPELKQSLNANVPELLLDSFRSERTARVDSHITPSPKSMLGYGIAVVLTLGAVTGLLAIQLDNTIHIKVQKKSSNPAVHQGTNTPLQTDRKEGISSEIIREVLSKEQASRKPPPLLPQQKSYKSYDMLLDQARSAYTHGLYGRARDLATQALLQRPDAGEATAVQALIALEEGRTGYAEELAKKIIITEPRIAEAYLVLGTIDLSKQRMADARTHFEHYLALAPHGGHAAEIRAVLKNMH